MKGVGKNIPRKALFGGLRKRSQDQLLWSARILFFVASRNSKAPIPPFQEARTQRVQNIADRLPKLMVLGTFMGPRNMNVFQSQGCWVENAGSLEASTRIRTACTGAETESQKNETSLPYSTPDAIEHTSTSRWSVVAEIQNLHQLGWEVERL